MSIRRCSRRREFVMGAEFGGLLGEVVGGGDPVAGGLRWWAGGKSRSLTPAAKRTATGVRDDTLKGGQRR